MIQNTNMYCHDCGKDFTAQLDMSLNGNHVIDCPHCEHRHYRVIENGKVTGVRWSSQNNLPTWFAITSTNTITFSSTTSGIYITQDSWLNGYDSAGTATY